MKDENGIEIKCENCAYYDVDGNPQCFYYGTTCPCNGKDITEAFDPSVTAYEARIRELKARVAELEARKPRVKRLVWEKLNTFEDEWVAPIGRFDFSIVCDDENFIVWEGDDELDLPSFDTLDDAKQAAQEWLDKLVADCAEMPKEDK